MLKTTCVTTNNSEHKNNSTFSEDSFSALVYEKWPSRLEKEPHYGSDDSNKNVIESSDEEVVEDEEHEDEVRVHHYDHYL